MTGPVDYHAYDWSPRRGDTERTPPVAVLTGDGGTVDLTEWTVRAQLRGKSGELLHTFVRNVGIILGVGRATFTDAQGQPVGDPVPTSTVRLLLLPDDWAALPPKIRGGVYDVEISRGTTVKTVTGGLFEPTEDVTRG